jgi:hypothetical protein
MNFVDEAILRPFSFSGGEFEKSARSVAEDHVWAHESSASYLEENGRLDLAKKQRELAAWWRGLATLSDAHVDRLRGPVSERYRNKGRVTGAGRKKRQAVTLSLLARKWHSGSPCRSCGARAQAGGTPVFGKHKRSSK